MIFVYAGNERGNITVKIQVPLFIFTPLFTVSRAQRPFNNTNHNTRLMLFRANCTCSPLTNVCC